jgi:hypothetical protein
MIDKPAIDETITRRDRAVRKLHKGLTDAGITDPLRILNIVTSFMSISKLEAIADFQDREKD